MFERTRLYDSTKVGGEHTSHLFGSHGFDRIRSHRSHSEPLTIDTWVMLQEIPRAFESSCEQLVQFIVQCQNRSEWINIVRRMVTSTKCIQILNSHANNGLVCTHLQNNIHTMRNQRMISDYCFYYIYTFSLSSNMLWKKYFFHYYTYYTQFIPYTCTINGIRYYQGASNFEF